MHDYQKLNVWKQAHAWVVEVYRKSGGFPGEERFGLTSQLRRAAVAVPTNLVEGCGRRSGKDVSHFVQIAIGSSNESEYLLHLARDLGYLDSQVAEQLMSEISSIRKQLISFQKRVESS
ncbi:MAG: hypothetical protein CVV27_20030 [Candidatus Melainabacteria bacterium HGW-Melainabacteria-1]|nr:MAG: hypothetical protein CVV27_20030 [Candidatus Melainabacteria bacterium HGW-Melainabacteria-1]